MTQFDSVSPPKSHVGLYSPVLEVGPGERCLDLGAGPSCLAEWVLMRSPCLKMCGISALPCFCFYHVACLFLLRLLPTLGLGVGWVTISLWTGSSQLDILRCIYQKSCCWIAVCQPPNANFLPLIGLIIKYNLGSRCPPLREKTHFNWNVFYLHPVPSLNNNQNILQG